MILLPSPHLKEALFTPLQAFAFRHLFDNLGVSSGERKINNFYVIYVYIPHVTNDGF